MKRSFFGIFVLVSILICSCNKSETTDNSTSNSSDSTAEVVSDSTANLSDSLSVDSDSTSK